MAQESRIKLTPVDGGDSFTVPVGQVTTIGRGTFLQITDKRVSRNHATLEINNQGKLMIVPIHTNPCFFRAHGNGPQTMLIKDQPKLLEHGDILALLPDKLAYRVVYTDQDERLKKKPMEGQNLDAKETQSNDDIEIQPDRNNDLSKSKRGEKLEKGAAKADLGAASHGKTRTLPDWMVGAGDRVGIGIQKPAKFKPPVSSKQTPQKHSAKPAPRAKPTPASNRAPGRRPKKPAVSDDDDEFVDDDDDDDEDYGDDDLVVKKRGKKTPARGGRRHRGSDDEAAAVPKRRPRAASLKKPKYTDDDFVISDEDLEVGGGLSSEEDSPHAGRRGRQNDDSDFILDDDESGSDWESSRKPQKTKLKKVKTPTPSKGRGRPPSGRGRPKRSRHRSDDDDISDDDDDNYVPRVSKRRAAVAAVSRMKQSSDYDEDDSDDEPPVKRQSLAKTSPRGGGTGTRGRGRPRKQVVSDDVDSENDSEDDTGKTARRRQQQPTAKSKPACQYGKECYRKNPKHFDEFSHPWMKSRAGDDDEDQNDDDNDLGAGAAAGASRQKRAAALKQKEKFEAMRKASLAGESDEDDMANGSRDDSDAAEDDGLNDSDFEMDTDSPVRAKGKSAKV